MLELLKLLIDDFQGIHHQEILNILYYSSRKKKENH